MVVIEGGGELDRFAVGQQAAGAGVAPLVELVQQGAHDSPVSRMVMLSRPGGRPSPAGAVPVSTFGTPW